MKKFLKICGRKSISLVDQLVNIAVIFSFLLMLIYGTYSVWDNQNIISAAQSTTYETYKPEANNDPTFEELQAKNKDVKAWLNIYGTQIDFPVAQGETNEAYLNKDVLGEYKMSGSLFLDYRDNADFSSFNSIIFGHHMAESAMFGDLDKFNEKTYFDQHQFGNLYVGDKNHGIKFFSFANVDAFDTSIYQTPVEELKLKTAYLVNIRAKAKFYRDIQVKNTDHIVVLSTCSSDSTNGRYVLFGLITNQEIPVPKAFQDEVRRGDANLLVKASSFFNGLHFTSGTTFILFALIGLILFIWYVLLVMKRKRQERGGDYDKKI